MQMFKSQKPLKIEPLVVPSILNKEYSIGVTMGKFLGPSSSIFSFVNRDNKNLPYKLMLK